MILMQSAPSDLFSPRGYPARPEADDSGAFAVQHYPTASSSSSSSGGGSSSYGSHGYNAPQNAYGSGSFHNVGGYTANAGAGQSQEIVTREPFVANAESCLAAEAMIEPAIVLPQLGMFDEMELDDEVGGEDITSKEAVWVLDSLEEYHKSSLTPAQRHTLESSGLRSKAKHRNAILFADDADFLVRSEQRLRVDEAAFAANPCNGDRRVFMLHEATRQVLEAYTLSRDNAPAKSCIFSALLFRVAYHLQRSGVADVKVEEYVEGVMHKEATLFVQGYHISRSNFTKLVRQILKKKSRGRR